MHNVPIITKPIDNVTTPDLTLMSKKEDDIINHFSSLDQQYIRCLISNTIYNEFINANNTILHYVPRGSHMISTNFIQVLNYAN